MRVVLLLLLAAFLTPKGVWAQADLSLYRVEDVTAVMTAPSAAQARDDAIIQAQHQALATLVTRLGAEGAAEGLGDEALGALVQAFEVIKEHASPGRYVGTFAVQFRPMAVRSLLDKKGMDYTVTQSRPVVVLPILSTQGGDVLWEENTVWREAWEIASQTTGLVPVIVPFGGLADIATISTREALNGDPIRIQEIIRKYEASGAVVAVLTTTLDEEGGLSEGKIEGFRYDIGGQALMPLSLTLAQQGEDDRLVALDVLTEGANKIIEDLIACWKDKTRETITMGPVLVMPVDVSVATLAEWTGIKQRLGQISSILRSNVVTMTRGLVHIELAFHGDIPSIQQEFEVQELVLEQTQPGKWELRSTY